MQFSDRAEKMVSDIREAVGSGRTLMTSLKGEGPYHDLTTVYSLIRFLDPGSVVREGEVSLLQSATGLWNQIQSELKKASGQGFITGPQKTQLRGLVTDLMKEYEQTAQTRLQRAKEQAGAFGMSWDVVRPAPIRFSGLLGSNPPQVASQSQPADVSNDPVMRELLGY